MDEKFINKTKELTKQLEDIKIAAIENEEQRELAALAKKLQRQKQEVNSAEADARIKKDLILALDEEYLRQSKAITDKYATEKNNETYDRDVNNLNAWNQTQQLLLLEQLNRGELTDQQYKDKLKQQERDFLQERKKLAIEYGKDVVDIEKQIQEDIRNEQENAIAAEKTKRRAQLDFNLQYAKAGSREELNARIAILTEQLHQELLNTNLTAEQKKIIWQAYYDTVSQMNRDFLAGELQEAQQYIDAFMSVFNAISALMSADGDRELARDKKINEEKKKNLKNQLDSKKITEAKYRSEIEKLDTAHAAKVGKIRQEQFKRDKIAKTVQAIINTAVGVTAALTLPPPASYVLAALTAAAGALQIAAISSAPEPEFEKGLKPTTGLVKGPSHAQEGIKLVDSQTGKIVGEMEGDEGIFSKKMYANNSEIIDAIFEAKGESIIPELSISSTDYSINIPDKKQIDPTRVEADQSKTNTPIYQAGKLVTSVLPVDQVTILKDKTLKLFESTNISEQAEALKNFKEYSDEVIRIYKDKTEVVNAIENNQKKVTSDISISNISKNETFENSVNAIDRVVTTISDRKVLAFQQSEYFKKAAYLISQAEDGMLTKESLEVNMKFLEKRLIERTVDKAPLPDKAVKDSPGTIFNPENDLNTVASRMVRPEYKETGFSGPKLNLPSEPAWFNQAIPQLNADRIIENIRMEESIKTMYIMEQLKKEFLGGDNKILQKMDLPSISQPVDQLSPAIYQLNDILNELKSKGLKGVWEHRAFSEGLEQIEEIQAKARF